MAWSRVTAANSEEVLEAEAGEGSGAKSSGEAFAALALRFPSISRRAGRLDAVKGSLLCVGIAKRNGSGERRCDADGEVKM